MLKEEDLHTAIAAIKVNRLNMAITESQLPDVTRIVVQVYDSDVLGPKIPFVVVGRGDPELGQILTLAQAVAGRRTGEASAALQAMNVDHQPHRDVARKSKQIGSPPVKPTSPKV